MELRKIRADTIWGFLNTISGFWYFQKRELWSKPVAKGQMVTEKLHFVGFDWTMLRCGGSPKVLRGSPDQKLHIVSLKLFSEKSVKKVSPINYIEIRAGEPCVWWCFVSIFLILVKSWFLESLKVLRVVKLYCRRHESQVFILPWFLWFNKSSSIQIGLENLTYCSWRTSENFRTKKVCFYGLHVVSSSVIHFFNGIIFHNSSFRIRFHYFPQIKQKNNCLVTIILTEIVPTALD